MFDYSRFSNCYIFRGARPLSLKEVIECLLCSESASAPSWLAWVEDSYIQTVFLMTYVGLSSPACMAAVLACSSVLLRTTLFEENSCDASRGSQTRTTCIVPIVFSRLLFKSPPDLHFWLYENILIYENWLWGSPGQPGCAQGSEEVPSANKGSRELGNQHLQFSK